MSSRRVTIALAATTLAGSGAYLFVYLYRWEWNRAIIAGVFFLAAEIALVAAAVLSRLSALETGLRQPPPRAASPRVLHHVREAAPTRRDHFAWLRPQPERMGVFVPILMGAGFVLSGLAWLVERVARSTAAPRLENRLAVALGAMALPSGHLLGADAAEEGDGALALLLGPDERARR
ncbi:MAG: hypothetical protein ABIS21_04390 [Acidimicrobiales bacterium]